jgi:hypothetical protein
MRGLLPIDGSLIKAMAQGIVVIAVYAGLMQLLGIAPEDRLVYQRALRKLGRLTSLRRRSFHRSA